MSDVAIVHQETVVAKEEQPLRPTLLEIASQSDSAEKLMEAALATLSFNDVKRISEATAQQCNSELWFTVRVRRITASILKHCIDKSI